METLSLSLRPPPLTADEKEAIFDAIEERAAIREYDGGEDRRSAEAAAKAAASVFRYRVAGGGSGGWLTMIAPGCTLKEARHSLEVRYGKDRVLEVVQQERNE